MPRGILREPLSALKRADIFVLSKSDFNPELGKIKEELSRINPRAMIIESFHRPIGFYDLASPLELLNPDNFKGKEVVLFSGIADPPSFERLIAQLKVNIGLSFRFPDHYHYSRKDLAKIISEARSKNIDTIITTEKDAARIQGLGAKEEGLNIFVLRIEVQIKDEQEFCRRLLKLYSF